MHIVASETIKPWTLDLIHLMQKEFGSFISHIPNDKKEMPTDLKNWSPKDELNHVIFWNTIFHFNVTARQKNQPILDPKNYLVMNDVGWFERKDFTWEETRQNVATVLGDMSALVTSMSDEELTDAKVFSVHYSKTPKPFIDDLLYEIVDHPLEHMLGMYKRFGNTKNANDLLLKIDDALANSFVAKWTIKSRKKIAKHLKAL